MDFSVLPAIQDRQFIIEHEHAVETRDIADVAAMVHFVRTHGRDKLDLSKGIDPADLPANTLPWVDEPEVSIINTENADLSPPAQVNTAIAHVETVEKVRQTLEEYPAASDHLREIVQTDGAHKNFRTLTTLLIL